MPITPEQIQAILDAEAACSTGRGYDDRKSANDAYLTLAANLAGDLAREVERLEELLRHNPQAQNLYLELGKEIEGLREENARLVSSSTSLREEVTNLSRELERLRAALEIANVELDVEGVVEERDQLRELLRSARDFIAEAKRTHYPTTTNSLADEWLAYIDASNLLGAGKECVCAETSTRNCPVHAAELFAQRGGE